MGETQVQEKVSVPEDSKKTDENAVTAEEKENLVQMLGVDPKEPETPEVKTEEKTDETKQEKPAEEAASEDKSEKTETSDEDKKVEKVEVDASEFLKIKRQAGMVEGLQGKGDQNTAELKKVSEVLANLVAQSRKPGDEKTEPIDADGLIKALSGDDGPAVLQQMIKEGVLTETKSLREQVEKFQEKNSVLEYNESLEEIAGDDYATLRPFMEKLAAAVADGVEVGDPVAIREKERIQSNEKYFVMLAREFSKSDGATRELAAKAERETEKKDAKDIGSSGGAKPKSTSDEPTDAQVKQGLEELMGLHPAS